MGFGGVALSHTIGTVVFFSAIPLLGAARAVMITNLEPVLGILFAMIILGERMSPVQGAGIALVIASIWGRFTVMRLAPSLVTCECARACQKEEALCSRSLRDSHPAHERIRARRTIDGLYDFCASDDLFCGVEQVSLMHSEDHTLCRVDALHRLIGSIEPRAHFR